METAHRTGMGRSLFWKKVSEVENGAIFLPGGEGGRDMLGKIILL